MTISHDIEKTYAYACDLFPGGVNSPVRACLPVGITPPILTSAYADSFLDNEGRSFLDFCCSWGSLIHGHHHPEIFRVIREESMKGISYGLTSENELIFASFLLHTLGLLEHKVRFVSSGTEATMTAVRLACGITQRSVIIKFTGCYHGHSDVFLHAISIQEELLESLQEMVDVHKKGKSKLPLTLSLPYNDHLMLHDVMQRIGHEVACIIFEPICANMGVVSPKDEFLNSIFLLCKRFMCLSIMDEVVTGFRCTLYGARSIFNVHPDIVTYGKIIGGGLPVAAIVAHSSIMDYLAPLGPVFQAGTLSGNPLAMATGYKSVQLCTKPDFYESLQSLTDMFCQSIEEAIHAFSFPVCLVKEYSMFSFFFTETPPNHLQDVHASNTTLFRSFYQQLFEKGIYLSPSPLEANFISAAHNVHNLNYVSESVIQVLKSIFA